MGAYRYMLAVLVLLSHMGISFLGRNQGVFAVISFFIISGYVMSWLIEGHYKKNMAGFYLDRLIRLFPQYIFYSASTLLFLFSTKHKSTYTNQLQGFDVFLNILMLPMAAFNFFPQSLLIPQAWSLGLECCFYLIFPLLFGLQANGKYFFVFLSCVVYFFAYQGIIDTDLFGYRYLPGTLFMFMMGHFLFLSDTKRGGSRLVVLVWLYCLALLAYGWITRAPFERAYNLETLSGILVGTVVVRSLSWKTAGGLSNLLGNLSYGIFLNHFLMIWIFQWAGIYEDNLAGAVAIVVASTFFAWMSYFFIERPFVALRHHLRSPHTL